MQPTRGKGASDYVITVLPSDVKQSAAEIVDQKRISAKDIFENIKHNVAEIKKIQATLEKNNKKADKIDRYALAQFQADQSRLKSELQQLIHQNQLYGQQLSKYTHFTPKEQKIAEKAKEEIARTEKKFLSKVDKGIDALQSSKFMRLFGQAKFTQKDLPKLKALAAELHNIKQSYFQNADGKTQDRIHQIEFRLEEAISIVEDGKYLELLKHTKFKEGDLKQLDKLAFEMDVWLKTTHLDNKKINAIKLKLGEALIKAAMYKLPNDAQSIIDESTNTLFGFPEESSLLRLWYLQNYFSGGKHHDPALQLRAAKTWVHFDRIVHPKES